MQQAGNPVTVQNPILDQVVNNDITALTKENPTKKTSKPEKIKLKEDDVIELNTDDAIKIPHQSHYISRRLLMTSTSEFIVNTYTQNNQLDPAVAMSSNGNFVITWDSYGEDGSGDGIYAQLFNGGATRQGSEFLVNTYTNPNQTQPTIDVSNSGAFTIAWTSYEDVDSVIFNDILVISSNGYCYLPSGACGTTCVCSTPCTPPTSWSNGLCGGTFTFTTSRNSLGIYTQSFSENGLVTGSETRVHTYGFNDEQSSVIKILDSGNKLFVWRVLEELLILVRVRLLTLHLLLGSHKMVLVLEYSPDFFLPVL